MDIERKIYIVILLCTYCTLVQAINGKVTKILHNSLFLEKTWIVNFPFAQKYPNFFYSNEVLTIYSPQTSL